MKIPFYRQQVTKSTTQPLIAKTNPSTGLREQDLAQEAGNLSQGLQSLSSVAGDALYQRNQFEIRDSLRNQQKKMDEWLDAYQSNKNILDADDLFKKQSKALMEEGAANLTFKGMRAQYEQAYKDMELSYQNKFNAIRQQRVYEDGIRLLTSDLDSHLETVGTTPESARRAMEDIIITLDESKVLLSPGQMNELMDQYEEKVIDLGIRGMLKDVFDKTQGSYLDKGDAAQEALNTQEFDELSTEQIEAYSQWIKSEMSHEHTVQGWREEEHDDLLTEKFTDLYIQAMETGSFGAAKAWVMGDECNPFYEPHKKNWYDALLRAEASFGGDPGGTKLPDAFMNRLIEIARDPNYDERFKDQAIIEEAIQWGLTGGQINTAMSTMNTRQKDFQSPEFGKALQMIDDFFLPVIEDEKKIRGLEGEELIEFYRSSRQQLTDILTSGEYPRDQILQVTSNILRDNGKRAIELELKTKAGLSSIGELHPENMDRVTDFLEMMRMAEGGQFMAVQDYYSDDLKNMRTGYHSMMEKIQAEGVIPGLNVSDGFIDDGKPRYTALVNGVEVDIQLMSDGTVQYLRQYRGEPVGTWVTLEGYDFYSPEDEERAAFEEQVEEAALYTEELLEQAPGAGPSALDRAADRYPNPYEGHYDDPAKEKIREFLFLAGEEDPGRKPTLTYSQRRFLRAEFDLNPFELSRLISEVKDGAD